MAVKRKSPASKRGKTMAGRGGIGMKEHRINKETDTWLKGLGRKKKGG
jgi:hypothetical protein